MARISKYTQDNEIIKDDSLLGTDFTSKATRNFSIETINNYLAKQSNILGNIFVYKYDQNQSYSNLGQGLVSAFLLVVGNSLSPSSLHRWLQQIGLFLYSLNPPNFFIDILNFDFILF